MSKVFDCLSIAVATFLIASCGNAPQRDTISNLESQISKEGRVISLAEATGTESGMLVCPYVDVESLDGPIKANIKSSKIDTRDDSSQWIVPSSESKKAITLERSKFDFCADGGSIRYAKGERIKMKEKDGVWIPVR